MATSEQTGEQGVCLCFRTKGVWAATDVITLISGASGIYDAFLAVDIQRRREDAQYQLMEYSLKRLQKYLEHPITLEFYHLWRDYMEMWPKEQILTSSPPPFPFPIPFTQQPYKQGLSAFDIFSEIDSFAASEDRLSVRRIHIASPGSFDLTGSGEIIREIRELIKDLWFRNRQEKTKGELDIINKYLTMRRENSDLNLPLPDPESHKLVRNVQERIHALQRLEWDGKLLSVPEHIDEEMR